MLFKYITPKKKIFYYKLRTWSLAVTYLLINYKSNHHVKSIIIIFFIKY